MRLHRPLLAAVLLVAGASTLEAQAALRAAPSPRATAAVELTFPEGQGPAGAQPQFIRLDYGQPFLRGRSLHTANLVPYDQPWRTGANAATTLTTDVDLVLGGQNLAKGTYVVWTLPSRTGWKMMLQKGTVGQMVMQYNAANTVATIDLAAQALTTPVEGLTMWLVPTAQAGATTGSTARGELRMAWGTTQLSTEWALK